MQTLINYILCRFKLILSTILIAISSVANAAPIQYGMEGELLLRKSTCTPYPYDVTTNTRSFPFTLRMNGDTDNVTSLKLAGIGTTYWNRDLTVELIIEGMGTFVLDNPVISASPPIFRMTISWGEPGFNNRNAISFSGLSTSLSGESTGDDIIYINESAPFDRVYVKLNGIPYEIVSVSNAMHYANYTGVVFSRILDVELQDDEIQCEPSVLIAPVPQPIIDTSDTQTVEIPPPTSGKGGCTVMKGTEFDPVFLLMLLFSTIYFFISNKLRPNHK